MMTEVENLYGLDKPDEQTDLKLKDASQEEIIEKTYQALLDATKDLRRNCHIHDVDDPFYKQACRIIRPFKESFTGTLRVKETPFQDYMEPTVGYYLSALLNETKLERLSIGKEEANVIGHRLQPDKIVEVLKNGRVATLGYYEEGGMIINRGEAVGMGAYTSNSILLNFGTISGGAMGFVAEGGIFLNFGTVESIMGYSTFGGVFVTKIEPKKGFLKNPKGPTYGVGPDKLTEDNRLSELMNRIERASIEEKFDDIKTLARKVDGHVRENYKPRKVA